VDELQSIKTVKELWILTSSPQNKTHKSMFYTHNLWKECSSVTSLRASNLLTHYHSRIFSLRPGETHEQPPTSWTKTASCHL